MSTTSLEMPSLAIDARAAHRIRELPVLVLMVHSRCNCRCVMCDIWRIRQKREITAADLEPHLASLRELKVRWVVFSGGEPLMHSDLFALARVLRREGIRTTLLTAGLLLEAHAVAVADEIDDVIVSLDGPNEIHDRIRGVPGAYRRLERGIQALRARRAGLPIHGRCTVQKQNFGHLRATVQAAAGLGLNSLSFLAADMSAEAFNHGGARAGDRMSEIALEEHDLESLSRELDNLLSEYSPSIPPGFIRESPEKLRRIVGHFRAHLGLATPVSPRCNAPWVSAVIESDGAVRPCFFHRPLGRLEQGTMMEVVNNDAALAFRGQLDVSRNPICQRCVCSLFLDMPV